MTKIHNKLCHDLLLNSIDIYLSESQIAKTKSFAINQMFLVIFANNNNEF